MADGGTDDVARGVAGLFAAFNDAIPDITLVASGLCETDEEFVVVVLGVHRVGEHDLACAGEFADGRGGCAGFAEGGQKDADEEGDDGNDDKELDEGEGVGCVVFVVHVALHS